MILLQNPTIESFAGYLQTMVASGDIEADSYPPISVVEEKDYYPVSSAQKRMFIIDQMENDSISYNIYRAAMIEADVDFERFERVLNTLINRHESLRTHFDFIQGEPVQVVNKKIDFNIEYMEADENTLKDVIYSFKRPFDLAKAPLFRVGLVKLNDGKYLLLYDMHHIITDGLSMEVFLDEFGKIYKGEKLNELLIQYKDFSQWQNELNKSEFMKKQEEYWLSTLSGELPLLQLPTDFARPEIKSVKGSRISMMADKKLVKDIYRFATDTNTTIYMLLFAAYNIMLSKYSAQEDSIIGTPIAGRSVGEIEKIIGMFVNTMAIRNYPEQNKKLSDFLEEVKKNALNSYINQDYQFEELVSKLNLKRDSSRNPLFDVFFVLQNLDEKDEEIDEFKCEFYEMEENISSFDITLEVRPKGNDLRFNMEYCTELFKKETDERVLARLCCFWKR